MITAPDIQTLKKSLLKVCYSYQHKLVQVLNSRISEIIRAEGLGNEEEYDNTSLAQLAERTTEADLLTESLRTVTNDLKSLQFMRANVDREISEVGSGAVVVTKNKQFYISTGIGNFEVDGVKYTGISMQSPLYQAMQGKKKGEKFFFKGHSYTIRDVY